MSLPTLKYFVDKNGMIFSHIILLFRELLNFSSDNADFGAGFVYRRGKEGGGGIGGSVLPLGFVVF